MLVYTNYGMRDFGEDPVECKKRGAWEFWVVLNGNITIASIERDHTRTTHTPTLWAFPPEWPFGCKGTGTTERAIFDFSAIPSELEKHLGEKFYYEEHLTAADCQRIRTLAELAMNTVIAPTQLVALQHNAILQELSLIALRSVELKPIKSNEQACYKVGQVLGWFASRMDENPTLEEAARFVHVSVSHLRRMFHQVRQESPKAAFTRVRKNRIEHLLQDPDRTLEQISEEVGLSSASTLTHFVQKHFHCSPGKIRNAIQANRVNGKYVPDF